ncbi:MAG: sporulation protein YabP [Clostridia bacterium]|nr:sporulation protein YabP [Clostridia bacterium]
MDNYEGLRRLDQKEHKVVLDARQRISISGVEDVDSFNENEVIFLTNMGMMTVLGEDLHIARLDLEAGMLVVEGGIQALDYSDHAEQRAEKSGLLHKLFR